MTHIDLGGAYHARPLPDDEYRQVSRRLGDRVFGDTAGYTFGPPHHEPPPLGEHWSWGLYAGATLIGWSHAHQRDERTVYMADTGLLPEHQGQGLYTRLLPHLLATFGAAGYTLVQSHHRATNNRILIPKLRAGFALQGLNLYEGGLNAALTYSFDATYREAVNARAGWRLPGSEAARRLGVRVRPPAPAPAPHVALPPAEGPELNLGGGYALRPVAAPVAWAVADALEGQAFGSLSFGWRGEPALPALSGPRYAWIVAHGGEVAGWQISRQWDRRTAYMVNTALLPQHRGQGVYSRLLPHVLSTLRAEGYSLVRSHHHATNNAVLIPKLRAGFRLQGLEVDHHGVLAVLVYPFDDLYAEYMDVRSGMRRPRGEVAARLGLEERGLEELELEPQEPSAL